MVKQTIPPTFNWELPDVEMPEDDGSFPVLTAEQWVVWFRTLPTYTQIATAAAILELQSKAATPERDVDYIVERMGRAEDTVESLRATLHDIKVSLRLILEQTKGVKPSKKRAALLAERCTAIGVRIKGMGL